MAVHAETPMPLIRVQDTTARYLPTSMGEMLRLWGSLFCFFCFCFFSFLLSVRNRRLHLISLRERNISRAYAKQTYLLLDWNAITWPTTMVSLKGTGFSRSVPVNAERAQAQHGDSHRGLLDEGDQFAEDESEGPVFCHQLQPPPP